MSLSMDFRMFCINVKFFKNILANYKNNINVSKLSVCVCGNVNYAEFFFSNFLRVYFASK